MSELPDSWAQVPLAAITSDVTQRVPADDETIRYIDIGSVNRTTKRIETPQKLLGKDAPSRARKQVAAGDTLVSMTRPNLNAVALVPKELDGEIASTGFDVLRPVTGIDPRWINYLVRTDKFVDSMSALVQGALYPAVRSKDVRAHVVPLAPVAEQTRIANQLDTLLTRIQSCNDRFDAIPALLKRFRQAVLDSAVVGRMTPIIDALSEPLRNGKSVRDGNGLPVLRLTALKSQIVNLNEVKYGDWSDVADTDRFLVHDGDYLVSRGNGSKDYVGRGGLVVGCNQPIAFPDTMIRFRPDVSQLLPGYLQLVWESEGVRTQIASSAKTTAGIWKVSQTDLERIIIPLPSLNKQAEIVRHVEALFTLVDRIEVRATAARNQSQRLSPLVLSKAFRGELVPQDPQDESAIDLLNHITAADLPAPKKRIAKAAAPGNSKVKVQGEGNRWNGEETFGATMKLEAVPDNYLEIFISAADGISAKELWQESKLGIDDFYAQLSKEIGNGLLTVDAQDESKICKIPKSRRG
ncbi:restriction endonuclease subunit S [Acidovorax sp.]|uniref:restriction endonuclease subunit S n=1 Tax=Acidovorax sp. TaxID=1872122 RepID=UPI0026181C3B|nr:restriction endonuclease subunit S [Acidovorax sp.]